MKPDIEESYFRKSTRRNDFSVRRRTSGYGLFSKSEKLDDFGEEGFISSNPRIVLSSCPPPCGHFSIQESATGGLSYKVKKHCILGKSEYPISLFQISFSRK